MARSVWLRASSLFGASPPPLRARACGERPARRSGARTPPEAGEVREARARADVASILPSQGFRCSGLQAFRITNSNPRTSEHLFRRSLAKYLPAVKSALESLTL